MADPELIELLAVRAMGWPAYDASGHRPGSRPLPHAWRVRGRRPCLMVYDGKGNREWNPLASGADLADLTAAMAAKGITPVGDLAPRQFCEAAAAALSPPPTKEVTPV